MNTPICDFINEYKNKKSARFHMPGHKGKNVLGFECDDITEIDGADELFDADGIIRESEKNASEIFGCRTFYSTEGSSLCIRAMLYLAVLNSGTQKPLIVAGRNAHKTFINTAALLDFDIKWIYPAADESYHSCTVTPDALEGVLISCKHKPCAVYITSPDYLGNISDIKALSDICHKYGVLMLVDNAHGAYLKFLQPSLHPIDLGADICCDSAHKTLPVLTGGAYLHFSSSTEHLAEYAKNGLALFASSSPSYLILQSLDKVNALIYNNVVDFITFLGGVENLRSELIQKGYTIIGDEALKITIDAKAAGYTGDGLSEILLSKGITCEFHDPDYIVFMLSPFNSSSDLELLKSALLSLEIKKAISTVPPLPSAPDCKMSPREAIMSACEEIPCEESLGRVLAMANIGCPPAVPIVMCGEIIDKSAIECFRYYHIKSCVVVK